MSFQEDTFNHLRAMLANVSNVREKKMFGKIAFMVNDKLCLAVGKEDIMCRIDPLPHEAVLHKSVCRPVIMRGREMKGYVRIKNEDLQEKGTLEYWVHLCLEYNKKIV